MSALTANNFNAISNPTAWIDFPVAASTTIYQGALVCLNGSGYAVPAADTSGFKFVGYALQQSVNTGSAGSVTVTVSTVASTTSDNYITVNAGTLATIQASCGLMAYAVDDQTVDITGNVSNHIAVGRIMKLVGTTQYLLDTTDRFVLATS